MLEKIRDYEIIKKLGEGGMGNGLPRQRCYA